MDSLATALPVKTDDPLKDSPHLASGGRYRPQLTDAELVTLAMMQARPGFTSEAKWLPRPGPADADRRQELLRPRLRAPVGRAGPTGVDFRV